MAKAFFNCGKKKRGKKMKYGIDFVVKQIGWKSKKPICPRCNKTFRLGRHGVRGRKTMFCRGCAVAVTAEKRWREKKC
jgi:hypothetical protein